MTDVPAQKRSPSPFSVPGPWDLVSQGYADVNLPFMGAFSEAALELLAMNADARLVDVACGPGTTSLLASPAVASVSAVDFSEKMLECMRAEVARRRIENVTLLHADGQALPFADESFDGAISMFGVMFFPDRVQGIREMRRVLVPGGRGLVSSWASPQESPLMMALFSALCVMDPSRSPPKADPESWENPLLFRQEMEEAGFVDVAVVPVTRSATFESTDAFWEGMTRGLVPLVMLRRAVGEPEFARQSVLAKEFLCDHLGSRRELASTAFLALGTKR